MRVPRLEHRKRWVAAAPALIVALPLTGFAFQHDERRKIYRAAGGYGADLLESVQYAYYSVETYLRHGNFRPIGRFAESLEHGFVFEAAEATALAPHAVHGIVRLAMVAILAVVAQRVVASLARSAGEAQHRPVVALFPMVLGIVLVANSRGSPLILFPFVFIGAAAVILAICLAVARDGDMRPRPLKRGEWLSMPLLGAAAAMTYDLVYVAPVLAATLIAARAVAAGMTPRAVLGTAATRRWTALSIGFVAVLIPSRIAVTRYCAEQACYAGSDISLSSDMLGVAVGRLLTGAPPAGWSYNADDARHFEIELTLLDLFGNSLLALLLLGVVAVSVATALSVRRPRPFAGEVGGSERSTDEEVGSYRWARLAAALGLFGAATAVLSALVSALSRHQQQTRPRIGQAWRETLLTQLGWSFMIAAVIAVILALGWKPARVVPAVTAILGVGLTLTLLANARITETYRQDPLGSITSQIAVAAINIDTTDGGNARRCSLIDAYTELTPSGKWIAGPNVRDDLNRLMLERYGWPFCDLDRLGR